MDELSALPPYEAKIFMLWAAKATEEYFKNPDVKRRFEEWMRQREKAQSNKDVEK